MGADTSRSSAAAFQPHRYTSYERDANGGDDAMMRRYHSYWNRFDQPDPYDGSYNLGDPQSFNRYSYTQSDPVNFVDPGGLDSVSGARNLLQNASCRSLFGKTNPLNLLDRFVRENRIRVSETYPSISYFRAGLFVRFGGFRPFGTAGAVTQDVSLHPAVSGPERNPYIWISSVFVSAVESGQQYAGYQGMSADEILGVGLIHELLHALGRIPHDGGGTPQADAQYRLNDWLVKEFCITIPNQPATTNTAVPNNSPTLRPVSGGGGGGGGYIGGGGYPGWWYQMWSFSNWVNSIPVGGGYAYVVGYHLDPPKKT